MDKSSILAELTANGDINRFSHTQSWQKAFDLYNKVHNERLNAHCGSCYRKVKAWLTA